MIEPTVLLALGIFAIIAIVVVTLAFLMALKGGQ